MDYTNNGSIREFAAVINSIERYNHLINIIICNLCFYISQKPDPLKHWLTYNPSKITLGVIVT